MAMESDFLITDDKDIGENTAVVVLPKAKRDTPSSCLNGTIVLSEGQRPRIVTHPLFDSSGKVDTVTPPTSHQYNFGVNPAGPGDTVTSNPEVISRTDNQVIRLGGGEVLVFKHGSIWSDNGGNPPSWFDEEKILADDWRKGQRGCIHIFKSDDCGNSWSLHPILDWGAFLGGKYGYPRPIGKDAQGNLVKDIDLSVQRQAKDADGNLLGLQA
jgi:hypothetical protein